MSKTKVVKVHVTHGDLRNDLAIPALVKMIKSPNYPNMRVVKKMSEIQKSLDHVFKTSQDAYIGLVKAYAVLDDKGNVVEQEGKPGSFTIPTDKQADWEKSITAFKNTQTEITLPQGKMTLDEVAKVGLTPQDIGAVAFIVE